MNENNFLIIVPQYVSLSCGYVLPLGILAVSAAIKAAGLPIHTLNLNHESDPLKTLSEIIRQRKITWIMTGGLSGEYKDIEYVFSYIHTHHPSVHLLLGGGIVTAQPEICMKAFPYVDVAVIGEGDISVPSFVKAILQGESLESIPGLILRKGDDCFLTPNSPEVKDLNALPFPDYSGFGYQQYLQENSAGLGWNGEALSPVSIIGSRSCPYHCTFCFHPTGNKYRVRDLDSVFQEIEFLLHHYQGINHIALREELFSANKDRIKAFCSRIRKYNLYWSIQLRINQVTEEVLLWLKEAGCFNIFLGIESADDTVLKSMKKGITLKQIENVLCMANKIGVMIRSGLIFGDPAETESSYRFSLEWLKVHRQYDNRLQRYNMYPDLLIPFPGSEVFRRAVREGRIRDQVAYLRAGCPPVNLTQMPDDKFEDMIREVQSCNYRSYYIWKENEHEMVRSYPCNLT